ncbi:MAG: DUF2807 domain-containing protein [Cytophagales bacterium]|nr:DUF2807 domain-containing protein [Cytophagales bacterium]
MKLLQKPSTVFISILACMYSCSFNFERGNGVIETREIGLDAFEKINIGGNYNVTLIESGSAKIVIETDENLLSYINVEHFNNTLSINNVHKLKSTRGINVVIYYTSIDKIYSTGASKVSNEGILAPDDLMINLSGAGAIDLEIDTKNVKVNLTGAGIIKLKGKTEYQETHISGAGGLSAIDLISNACNINLSGLGGAEVHAVKKIEATITGVGGIIYAGNPEVIERQVTGFGKIKRAKEYRYEDRS